MQLMIYIHYWLLFLENDNFKHTTASQRLTFKFFLLFYIFLSRRFLSYYLFSDSHARKNITSIIYIAYRILWEFLVCNVLHSVRNMYWWTFLRGLFYCYSYQIKAVLIWTKNIPVKWDLILWKNSIEKSKSVYMKINFIT